MCRDYPNELGSPEIAVIGKKRKHTQRKGSGLNSSTFSVHRNDFALIGDRVVQPVPFVPLDFILTSDRGQLGVFLSVIHLAHALTIVSGSSNWVYSALFCTKMNTTWRWGCWPVVRAGIQEAIRSVSIPACLMLLLRRPFRRRLQ